MKDLIEALTIIAKYLEPGSSAEKYPTTCEHDTLYVCVFDADSWKAVDKKDKARLKKLGFDWDKDDETLISYRFGSC